MFPDISASSQFLLHQDWLVDSRLFPPSNALAYYHYNNKIWLTYLPCRDEIVKRQPWKPQCNEEKVKLHKNDFL